MINIEQQRNIQEKNSLLIAEACIKMALIALNLFILSVQIHTVIYFIVDLMIMFSFSIQNKKPPFNGGFLVLINLINDPLSVFGNNFRIKPSLHPHHFAIRLY
ncbi:hypothetical protein I3679_022485 [Proteus mirabilis]|uniref:Uncharacterized protein n=1 Tax=Proteus mirabilis TaxID=584 RepID=A0ABD5LW02_PROMI